MKTGVRNTFDCVCSLFTVHSGHIIRSSVSVTVLELRKWKDVVDYGIVVGRVAISIKFCYPLVSKAHSSILELTAQAHNAPHTVYEPQCLHCNIDLLY